MIDIIRNRIVLLYQYFYRKKYSEISFIYTVNEKSFKQIDTFISLLIDRIGVENINKGFLWNYFLFHFFRLEDQLIERYSTKDDDGNKILGKFQLIDFIGKKAINQYFNRNNKYDFLFEESNLIEKYSLNKRNCFFYEKKLDICESETVNISEEIDRGRFFGSAKGFAFCIERTTLFNPLSRYCKSCYFSESCKKVQKNKLPDFHRYRNN